MPDRDDGLLLRILRDLRQKIDKINSEQQDLRALVGMVEDEIATEQRFRRRHEEKIAEISVLLERMARRLELSDDADSD